MKKTLIIDVGHDARRPGTYQNGYQEYILNLLVARRLHSILSKEGVDVSINQTKSSTLSDRTRIKGIKNKYQYCMSIHFNAGGGAGLETIHSVNSAKGKRLARTLARKMNKETGIPIRRIFSRKGIGGRDYYFMHRSTGSTCTVICEGLFLDNIKDLKQLNIEKIARGWANGFLSFLKEEKPDKEPEKEAVPKVKAKHKKIGLTHVVEIDPMNLKVHILNNSPFTQFPNMATSGYQWYSPSNSYPALGILVSEGRIISNRQPHYKPAGTLIVYRDGSVKVKPVLDIKREGSVWFAVSGCSVYPDIRMKEEGFTGIYADIGRETHRMTIAYRSSDNKIILAYRPASNIERAHRTLKNLGCDSGIVLDSGDSSLLRSNEITYRSTNRKLYSVITW